VTKWRPSDPERGKASSGSLLRSVQITINRPDVRNAPHAGGSVELLGVPLAL